MVPVNRGVVGDAFTFGEPYETQPGKWAFDLLVGNDVVASQSFKIVTRKPGSPASICAAPPISSGFRGRLSFGGFVAEPRGLT